MIGGCIIITILQVVSSIVNAYGSGGRDILIAKIFSMSKMAGAAEISKSLMQLLKEAAWGKGDRAQL
jgi:hypothetical protein